MKEGRNIRLLVLFILVITGLSLVYDYPETLLKRPQSIHNWRQCDGASLALNYYQEGMHFFKPQTHMLYSDGYTTGYTCPSEIPILYYFVALLYNIFGYHEYIFRALNLLIFYIGLYYLFRLANSILKDLFYATVVTILLFTAPVLVYYANNFMPNTVALSFSFIGWYYFYEHFRNGKTKTFLISMIFFGIASAMKITELIGPIIVLGFLISDKLKIFKLDIHTDVKFGLKVISVLTIFAVIGCWVMYARHYNELHQSVQFMTYSVPIWSIGRNEINMTLHKMNVLWFKDYFYPATFWLMVACLVIMITLWKRSDKIIRLIVIAEVSALVLFSLLWFYLLGDHDYFYIGFYVLPAFLFINFFLILKKIEFKKWNLFIIRVVFAAVVIMNVYYAQERHNLRYYRSWMNDYEQQKDLYSLSSWLRESGITKDDRVIFYPSRYIRPLYLMNVKGWTIFDHDTTDRGVLTRDSVQMSVFTEKGAQYFITNDIKSAVAHEPLKPYMKDLYAKYNSVFVFRLPPGETNFVPTDSLIMSY